MAKDEEPTESTATVWGTWDELLLASAVKRHGFQDWDSVAMEVQARSSLPNLLATARNCELKFRDLKRRFGSEMKNDDVSVERENGTDFGGEIDGFPWIDELKKLRVAELKQEVQRSDVSIHSLQLKVKRLEEERDRCMKKETSLGKPDLEKSREQRSENDNKCSEKSDRSEPERTAVKVAVTGEESDREYHSVNESNSTGSKSDDAKTGEGNTQSESKPGLFSSDRSEPLPRDSKPVTADSDNGSSDTVARKPACEPLDTSLEKKVNESSELDDSLARSNGGEEGTRESSEVQSSASLAGKRKRKKRQRREIRVGPIGEEAPPQATAAVEQLEEMMRTIQAHHHSYLFESRLRSQESEAYKNMVRQHMDLDTIRAKLDKGSYESSSRALYRDFLLLFTNAVVFFPKSSSESIAGSELVHLVLGEIKKAPPQPSLVDNSTSLHIPALSQVPKIERSDSLLAKQKSAVPIIVCRKRSSIATKTSSIASIGNKGEEHHNDEKKPSVDVKPPVETTSTVVEEEEPIFIKENKAKDKTITGARSLRRIHDGTNIPTSSGKRQSTGSVLDKKKPDTVPLDKKRSAADFLKRIKQNSLAENLSTRAASVDGGEQKKSGVKGEKGKERMPRQSKEKKPAREDNSPSKRSVGRPPKKVADKNAVSTKRAREGGGKEPLKRPRKRSKR